MLNLKCSDIQQSLESAKNIIHKVRERKIHETSNSLLIPWRFIYFFHCWYQFYQLFIQLSKFQRACGIALTHTPSLSQGTECFPSCQFTTCAHIYISHRQQESSEFFLKTQEEHVETQLSSWLLSWAGTLHSAANAMWEL